MIHSSLALAIDNNAQWCALMWQSHHLPVVQQQGLVACPATVPDFYPNLVTTSDDGDDLLASIAVLRDRTDSKGFSLKDSFGKLDLEPLGMRCLFAANWLLLPSGSAVSAKEDLAWQAVSSEQELGQWEAVWDERDAGATRIFLPALLKAEGVTLWGGWSEGQLKAGYVANVTGPVVGISNTFGPYDSVIAQAVSHYADKDLVTYEANGQLDDPLALGFEALGGLKIWIS